MERYSDVMCPIDRMVMSTKQHDHAAFLTPSSMYRKNNFILIPLSLFSSL